MSEQNLSPSNNHRSRALWGLTSIIAIVGLLWLGYWYFYLQYHESTDDAYARGLFTNINPNVPGSVIAFYADDTDLVKEGQLLVELDTAPYFIAYKKELATLASSSLQVKQLFDDVQTNRAKVESLRIKVEKAKFDYENRLNLHLHDPEAVANEDYVHSNQDYLMARYGLEEAKSELKAALAGVGNYTPENHPLIEQQKEKVRNAFYNLTHCSIYAPSTGYVAKRSVGIGEWVNPSTNLMTIISVNDVWVEANFKETQLKKMRVGQPAAIWFDLYGTKIKYHGKIIGIASGTGSVFSLIPPQNATGNWIKIVQRLPVRISLDAETVKAFPPRLGLSAEVTVDVTEQDLPMLATSTSFKSIAKTEIFDINLDKVNQLMDKIVREE